MKKKEVSLLLDIGNSTVTAALNTPRTISSPHHFSNLEAALSFFDGSYTQILASSVVPKLDTLLIKKAGGTPCCFINYTHIPNMKVNLKHPQEVGADRLLAALAAYQTYKRACLVIDSGTALTYCLVTEGCVYQGGAIFPGMGIASKSLHEHTAKIPLILVEPQSEWIGKSTQDAVKIGLYHGYILAINGMIKNYKTEYPELHVVVTGQGINCIKDKLKVDSYAPNLVIQGLAYCDNYKKRSFTP